MMQGIYEIENINNGMVYVGSSKHIEQRWREHKNRLKSGKHDNIILQSAWNHHGEHAFVFRVIELVENKGALISREQWWFDKLQPFPHKNNGYNMARVAGKPSEERRPESIAKTAAANRGTKRTPESKAKMRLAKLGTKQSEATRKKRSLALMGIKRNPKQFIGENHPRTKLKNSDALRIKELVDSGYTCATVAAMYNIDRTSVNNIKLCKTWKCVLNGRNN